ncbi:hypothetical protein KSK55_15005 [Methanospirillum purgamenti]|uniref:Uncharacterized protein n=1 Tax=Methanospirillum hungatei TaxID=2203 RepID=A0A8F5VM13_METHU|nr:hypothetical protein [Methanospirillum hungatei]QXO94601.1 hypothetical protein KSK55_15005 [Methanospirillum hungatei]
MSGRRNTEYTSRGSRYIDVLIEFTGCCQEPYTGYKVRESTPVFDLVSGQ